MRIGRAVAALMAYADIFSISFLIGNQFHDTVTRRDDRRADWRVVVDAIVVLAHMQNGMNAPAETIVETAIRQGLRHEIFRHGRTVFIEIAGAIFAFMTIKAATFAAGRELDKNQFRFRL